MYQALYRKYRPRKFTDVIGQQHITQTLCNQIIKDRTSHAYLFIGTRGTGKTTCARILSRAINCTNPVDGNPCNECPSCHGIENGTILDVLELDAASNNGVDDVRELREEAIYSPASVKKRVYIIDEVHMLSSSAFNALLKILEEPPEHILFILATTELHKVPATIQSRCQMFSFRRLSQDEIKSGLDKIAENEELTITPDASDKLALLADGSMRDAVSLFDQCITTREITLEHVQNTLGLASEEEILRIIHTIAQCDIIAALEILDSLYKNGKDMAALLNELSGVLRDLLLVRLAPDTSLIGSSLTRKELAEMSQQFKSDRLFYCLEIAKNTLIGNSRSGITKLTLEMCLIRMIDERLSDDPAALTLRISNLEDGNTRSGITTNRHETKTTATVSDAEEVQPDKTIESEKEDIRDSSNTKKMTDSVNASKADDTVSQLIAHIKEPGLCTFLSDSNKISANVTDGTLVLHTCDEFVANTLKNLFMDALKDAARVTFGREIMIRVEVQQESDINEKKSKRDIWLAAQGENIKITE